MENVKISLGVYDQMNKLSNPSDRIKVQALILKLPAKKDKPGIKYLVKLSRHEKCQISFFYH